MGINEGDKKMNRRIGQIREKIDLFALLKAGRMQIRARWAYAVLGGIVFFGSLFIFDGWNEQALIISSVAAVITMLLIVFMGKALYRNAFLIIVCFGMLFCLVTPILDTPDETAHLARAMYLARGKFFVSQEDSQLLISEDYKRIYSQSQKTLFKNDLNVSDSGILMIESNGLKATNAYAFVSYLPQALGIGFGRLINLSVLWSYYLGRITNLLFYAIMIALAIKITPLFKQLFFIAGTIPMGIYIAASYNQDAFGIGIIFVTLAFYFRLLSKQDHQIKVLEIVGYTGLCMLITVTKFPFVLLVLLPAFIPLRKFDKAAYQCVFLGIILAAGFSLAWMKFYTAIPHPFVPEGVNMIKQIQFLIGDPIVNMQMMGQNLLEGLINYLMLFNFGWLSYGSNGLGLLYLFFYGSVAVFYPRELRQSPATRIGALLVAAGIYVAITLSMYLTWTPVGSSVVNGVQGRYFIGFLPLIPLMLNIGPSFKQLEPLQIKQYGNIVTLVPVYFLIMSFTLTLKQYY